jgi:SsrA-binding protein
VAIKIIIKNKKASYEYFLQEKIEAGMQLQGTEVKSIRNNKVQILDAYVQIDGNLQVWIHNMRISPYEFGNIQNHTETRKRKLLLNKKEIIYIQRQMVSKGLTLIPTMLYYKNGKVKLEICLAKGKKLHDKRQSSIEKEVKKNIKKGDYNF